MLRNNFKHFAKSRKRCDVMRVQFQKLFFQTHYVWLEKRTQHTSFWEGKKKTSQKKFRFPQKRIVCSFTLWKLISIRIGIYLFLTFFRWKLAIDIKTYKSILTNRSFSIWRSGKYSFAMKNINFSESFWFPLFVCQKLHIRNLRYFRFYFISFPFLSQSSLGLQVSFLFFSNSLFFFFFRDKLLTNLLQT
jgi:hypothetical protein